MTQAEQAETLGLWNRLSQGFDRAREAVAMPILYGVRSERNSRVVS